MEPVEFFNKFKKLLDDKFLHFQIQIETKLRKMKTMDGVYSEMDSLNYDRIEGMEKDMEEVKKQLQEIKDLIRKK